MNERVVRRVAASMVCLMFVSAGCRQATDNGAENPKTIKLAFVTNNSADFWTIARRGVEKADAELRRRRNRVPPHFRRHRGRAAADRR